MPEEVDVLIVGGGPAGLAAAETAAAGGTVLLVHRDACIGLPVRTSGGSWRRDLVRLGIPETLYHPIESLTLAGPARLARVRFGADRPVVLEVTETYRYLADLAVRAGAILACGTSFEGIASADAERAVCRIRSGGASREVAARFVVDASGHRRAVLAGLGAAGRPDRIGVGVENEYDDRSPNRANATLFIGERYAPCGYGWIFPTRRGTVRVGVGVIRPDTAAAPAELLARFMASGLPDRLGLHVGDLVERHTGVIPSDGPAGGFIHGRCVAVGDSAGQALPLVGEGIRYCIDSGRQAGEALARALRDPRRYADHLAQYERWWSGKHRRSFELAQKANVHLSAYSDRQWDDKVEMLSLLDGDLMAAFLRMELSARHLPRLLGRRPLAAWRLLSRRALRRFY